MKPKDTLPHAWPLVDDLQVFLTVVSKQSFAAAAAELGLSPAYVSKRINLLEKGLGVRLFFRTTRHTSLTPDGEKARDGAKGVLDTMSEFISGLSDSHEHIQGHLNISCSFGFGEQHMAAALAEFSRRFPQITCKLTLSDRVMDLIGEGIDIEIRIGNDIKELYIAKKLADNARILCASPAYLAQHGIPAKIEELARHACLVIQERNSPFGVWRLTKADETSQVRVKGPLSSNSGVAVLNWALAGHGIICRSRWDVQKYIDGGQLIHLLPEYAQSADIWAVYTVKPSTSTRLKLCVDFLADYFQSNPPCRSRD
ncbi:LysR family transcriptional regulator [Sodalis sp. dw_96]|uniref:LysR family transcriptional regulator n=1 Tax=Sodalis sp. dw_96 TaxID=2719794 RepID=UPI001BD1C7C6|nr:LysR family transcriptional regulator [Sodalis sp. dw_96]